MQYIGLNLNTLNNGMVAFKIWLFDAIFADVIASKLSLFFNVYNRFVSDETVIATVEIKNFKNHTWRLAANSTGQRV